MTGRIVSVNVSPGGVPKRDVGSARVGTLGLEGDGHDDTRHHGGPAAAVCIYSIEAIGRIRSEGHQAFPGAFGENLTLEGVELAGLAAGDRLTFGDPGTGLLVELTRPTTPCSKQARWFRDGDISRISHDRRPMDARWYGRVLREGVVSVGDAVEVAPGTAEGGPASGAGG